MSDPDAEDELFRGSSSASSSPEAVPQGTTARASSSSTGTSSIGSRLHSMASAVSSAFPNLDVLTVRLCEIQGSTYVLHVRTRCIASAQTGVSVLAPFHVIIGESQAAYIARLLAFNGKEIRSEQLSLSSVHDSKLLNNLSHDQYDLCPGIGPRKNCSQLASLLREFQGNRIVYRSQKCDYCITEEQLRCEQCEDLQQQDDQFKLPRLFGSKASTKVISFSSADRLSEVLYDHIQNGNEVTENSKIYDDPLEVLKSRGGISVIAGVDLSPEAASADLPPLAARSAVKIEPTIRPQRNQKSSNASRPMASRGLPRRGRPPKRYNAPRSYALDDTTSDEGDALTDHKSASASLIRDDDDNDYLVLPEVSFDDEVGGAENGDQQPSDDKPICKHCNRVFNTSFQYAAHQKRCIIKQESNRSTEKVNLTCDICLRTYTQERPYKKHIAFHESRLILDMPVTCPFPGCGVEVENKRLLNPHFQKVHDSTKGVCVECLQTVDADFLKRHIYRQHFYNVKDRLCTTCGKSFATPLKLRVHMSQAHDSTETACVCDKCGKKFPHKIILNHHMYHYHRDKLFPCHTCDKVFKLPMSYYKHVRIHSTTKPYTCALCQYRAIRKDNVRQHVRKVHKIEDDPEIHVFKDGNYRYEAVEAKKREQEEMQRLLMSDLERTAKEDGEIGTDGSLYERRKMEEEKRILMNALIKQD